MAHLEIIDLKKHFKVRKGLFGNSEEVVKAVDGVSLSLKKGEILGLVGESGCGKTTLSRVIMQLIRPTSGEIILNDENLAALEEWEVRERRIEFQMIFQDPYASLNPRMTVYTALAEAVRRRHVDLDGSALRGHIAELMERVGLDPKFMRKYPHEFSGGQRQRIAIARSLAPEPKLILADEPVSALDVSIQSQILNLLRKLTQELDLTMMFISHDLSVVRYIADRIAVMREGVIVELGEANDIFENPSHQYTRDLLQAIPRIAEYA